MFPKTLACTICLSSQVLPVTNLLLIPDTEIYTFGAQHHWDSRLAGSLCTWSQTCGIFGEAVKQ